MSLQIIYLEYKQKVIQHQHQNFAFHDVNYRVYVVGTEVQLLPPALSGDGEVRVQKDRDIDFPHEEGAAEDNNLKPKYFSIL